jgi:hypothetical protein
MNELTHGGSQLGVSGGNTTTPTAGKETAWESALHSPGSFSPKRASLFFVWSDHHSTTLLLVLAPHLLPGRLCLCSTSFLVCSRSSCDP